MASCVRVLLLSLLAFGHHAKALSYRSQGYDGNKPALGVSSFERSSQPGASLGSYVPSYNSGGDYGGSYGRQVNGYSQEGSVSSYNPGPQIVQKPRQTPQQQYSKTNPNTNGGPKTKAGMWDFASPQNGNGFETAIVSSYGIEMRSDKLDEPQQLMEEPQLWPTRLPSYLVKPQQPGYGVTQSKAGMWDVVSAKPQPRPMQHPGKLQPTQRPSYRVKPQQPGYGVTQSKAGMWDAFAKPQPRPMQHPGKLQPTQRPSYRVKPQQPGYGVTQSKAGMWDAFAKPQPRSMQHPGKLQPTQHPSYRVKPQQPGYGVTQSKAGMWDAFAKPQPRPMQHPGKVQPTQRPSYRVKPQQPGSGVTQSKDVMWDFALSQDGVALDSTDANTQTKVNLKSSRPVPRAPVAPVYQSQWRQQVPVYNGRQPWEGS